METFNKGSLQRTIHPRIRSVCWLLKLDNGTPVFVNTRREVRHIYDLDIEGDKFRVVKRKAKMESIVPRDFTPVETPRASGRQKRKA